MDELYRVAGLWHDEGDWSHVWPIGFAWIWTDDERAEAVDAVFEGLELVGQVRKPPSAIRQRPMAWGGAPLCSQCAARQAWV